MDWSAGQGLRTKKLEDFRKAEEVEEWYEDHGSSGHIKYHTIQKQLALKNIRIAYQRYNQSASL
jgi:hypothetical protein